MDLATLVMAAVLASVSLIVFSLGLGSTQEDALSLLRRPRQLVRSLLSMNVVMPLVAAGLAAAFDFPRCRRFPQSFRRGSSGPADAHPMRSGC